MRLGPPTLQNANYAIQNGCNLARARVLRFKHNDVADLERVLERVAAEDRKSKCAASHLSNRSSLLERCPGQLPKISIRNLNSNSNKMQLEFEVGAAQLAPVADAIQLCK